MTRNDDRLDTLLDRTLDELRSDVPSTAVVDQAAEGVWQRLTDEAESVRTSRPETAAIRSCDDYRRMIPAYLDGRLSEGRSLLLEDHSRECIPCRKALKSATSATGSRAAALPARRTFAKRRWFGPDLSWGLAAAVVVGLALVGFAFKAGFLGVSAGGWIRVETVDGSLFQVSEILTTPAVAGEVFQNGEPIRTGKDSGAVFALEDGSRVEMNERSEVRVTRRGDDHTIHLTRGDIIVEAADQGEGRLYVQTDDCKVEVAGTVFAVSNGTKGSRVSVIEGEVHVAHGRRDDVLLPGDQVTTTTAIRRIPVEEDIAWSRNLDEHLALLREFAELGRELDERLPDQPSRYSTRLLDAAPEGTVVYVAIPNLTDMLSEAHALLTERIETSATLRQWWQREVVESGAEPELQEAIDKIRQFGEHLGDEIVLTLQVGGSENLTVGHSELRGPVVMSTLNDPAGFRDLLAGEIERLGGEQPGVRIVEDPFGGSARTNEFLFWIAGDLLVGAPRLEDLQHTASLIGTPGSSRFVGSPFHADLAAAYREGTGFLVGADLRTILASQEIDDHGAGAMEVMGLTDVEHFIVERHDAGETNVTRAALSFTQTRSGVLSWLAEPAPMGSLEFISPDAMVASAFVVRAPASLLEDLFVTLSDRSDDFRRELEQFQTETGLDLVRDVAAPLGGEFAFALDGPILPKPAWKVVVEVYDPVALQRNIEFAVDRLNRFLQDEGHAGIRIETAESRGRTYHALISDDFGLSAHYTFVEGYLLAASQRAMIDRTLQLRASGIALARSRQFTDLLPRDRQANFSAVLYQHLGRALDSLTESGLAQSLSENQKDSIRAIAQYTAPSVYSAYGEADRIEVVGADRGNLVFGTDLGRLLNVGSILELGHALEEAAQGAE